MYQALGLLRPDSDFSIDEAHARLTARFPDFQVARSGERIDLRKGDWWLALVRVTGTDPEETEGLLARLAGVEPAEADAYLASGAQVELFTDVPDPFMEHFNDYVSVVEVLKGFRGLLAVDPKQPGVL